MGTLQVTLGAADVKVEAFTIRKRLYKFDLCRIFARKKLKKRKHESKFAREHIVKDQDFWNNVVWTK